MIEIPVRVQLTVSESQQQFELTTQDIVSVMTPVSGMVVISENSVTDISPYQYASVQVLDGITFANGVNF